MVHYSIDVIPSSTRTGLCVHGELDMSNAAHLLDTILCAAIPEGTAEVSVDLGDVSFLDSSALSALLHARKRASEIGVDVRLVEPSSFVRRLLEISGLEELVDGLPMAAQG